MPADHGMNGTRGSDFAPPRPPSNVPSPKPSPPSGTPRPRPSPGPRPRGPAARVSATVVPSGPTMRSPMLVMYGTFQTPCSPGTRPRLGVPSARRGVGSGGATGPPRPRSCAPTPKNAVNGIAMIALSSAPRSRFRTLNSASVIAGGIALTRRGKEPLAGGRQHDRSHVPGARAVLGLTAFDGHDVADLGRVARPALTHQAVGAAHLHAPVHDLAVRFGHVHIEIRVRVLPLDLGDHAFQIERLLRVELRRKG